MVYYLFPLNTKLYHTQKIKKFVDNKSIEKQNTKYSMLDFFSDDKN